MLTKAITTLVVLALAALSGGCDREQPGLSVAVGGAPAEVDFWSELVAEFTADTGIAVRLDRQPTDTDLRRQELVFALQARKRDPDVFLLDVAWLAQFAASGWLLPLDPESMESGAFFKRVIDLADTYDGGLIALPVYIDGGILYYRKDLLAARGIEEPPETWAELVNIGTTIQAEQRKQDPQFQAYVWQGAQYEGLVCNFLEFAVSAGGGISIAPGRVEIDSAPNRRALTLMTDLIHRYHLSPPNTYTEMHEEEARLFFQNGHALFERNWPYAWAEHESERSPVRGKVGIAPLPHFQGGRSASTLGGWHIGISKFCDRPDEARRFVQFVVSRSVQKRLAMALGWNPGRRDVYNDPEVLAQNPHFAILDDVFANAVPRPAVSYYPIVSKTLQKHLNAALSGRITAADALRACEADVREIVSKYSDPDDR